MSKPTKARQRPQLSRAEIKAYEARRAAETRRLVTVPDAETGAPTTVRRSYVLSRDEEYRIIRSDLRRLLLILAILTVVLVICTLWLR